VKDKGPTEALLRRRASELLVGGVEWVTQQFDLFTPSDVEVPDQMKAVTELAMFYGYTTKWWRPEFRRRLVPIRQFLADLFADEFLAHWMRRLPCHFPHYATGYLALRAAGERFPAFEEAISCLHRSGYPFVIEKTPYRELASQYSLWKAGLRAKPPTFGKYFLATSAARFRSPVYLSKLEAYSVTHTLFYVADIAGPCLNLPETDRRRVCELLETLLIHYWRKADWDVTGELLLNLIALDQWTTTLFEDAFADLLTAKREDGTVPGPQFSAICAEPSRSQTFDGCYHTTLVAMFLCGAYVYRTRGDAWRRSAS
jgi:hypothetical protein